MKTSSRPVVICKVNRRARQAGDGPNWNAGDRIALKPDQAKRYAQAGLVTILTKPAPETAIREAGGVDEFIAQNPAVDLTGKYGTSMEEIKAGMPGATARDPDEDGIDTLPDSDEDDGLKRVAAKASKKVSKRLSKS